MFRTKSIIIYMLNLIESKFCVKILYIEINLKYLSTTIVRLSEYFFYQNLNKVVFHKIYFRNTKIQGFINNYLKILIGIFQYYI